MIWGYVIGKSKKNLSMNSWNKLFSYSSNVSVLERIEKGEDSLYILLGQYNLSDLAEVSWLPW